MDYLKNTLRKILYKIPLTRKLCLWRIYMFPYIKMKFKNPNLVFLLMTPEHTNLGDHAIAIAEKQLLDKMGIPFIEITGDKLFFLKKESILKFINKQVLFINGGGNLGTLWLNVENLFRHILIHNKNSLIVVLPNTIYYGNSVSDQKELETSKKIYNRHKNLLIYAREKYSYEYMKKIYKNVALCPDIVLSLKKDDNQGPRNGCLLCLRSDCEKTRTEDQESQLLQQVQSLFGSNYRYTDMYATEPISVDNRADIVDKKLNEFKHAELVITDRLHGMIFCAITGTPCLIINSKSPKVKNSYEWIKYLEYIRFVDDINDIKTVYMSIPKKIFFYDNTPFLHYYDELAETIKNVCKGKNYASN